MAKEKSKPASNQQIFAVAIVRRADGRSLLSADGAIDSSNVASFVPQPERIQKAAEALREMGFRVTQQDEVGTVSIEASVKELEEAFRVKLIQKEEEIKLENDGENKDEQEKPVFRGRIYVEGSEQPDLIDTRNTEIEDLVAGISIAQRPELFASAFSPALSYWHLDVPGDVSLGMNADKIKNLGLSGEGVKIAMVDTGLYQHPFYTARGYNIQPVVLAPDSGGNPLQDNHGHGTAEAANIFAVAPGVELTMVKTRLVDPLGAFNKAASLKPHIITCSWGYSIQSGSLTSYQQSLSASVALAVSKGIAVVFAAGNGHWGFPGQHPDVISVGGAYLDQNGGVRASNYASGFASNIYPGRTVPDVAGLVGQSPRAIYISLPVQPGCSMDVAGSGSPFPWRDTTASNDGWAVISGTSAAAPQVAGILALMKQANPCLKPQKARELLKQTARDVVGGTCHSNTGGHTATAGHDLATGYGLADATAATSLAYIHYQKFCRKPQSSCCGCNCNCGKPVYKPLSSMQNDKGTLDPNIPLPSSQSYEQ